MSCPACLQQIPRLCGPNQTLVTIQVWMSYVQESIWRSWDPDDGWQLDLQWSVAEQAPTRRLQLRQQSRPGWSVKSLTLCSCFKTRIDTWGWLRESCMCCGDVNTIAVCHTAPCLWVQRSELGTQSVRDGNYMKSACDHFAVTWEKSNLLPSANSEIQEFRLNFDLFYYFWTKWASVVYMGGHYHTCVYVYISNSHNFTVFYVIFLLCWTKNPDSEHGETNTLQV